MKKLFLILFSLVSAELVNVKQRDLKTPLNQFVRKSEEFVMLTPNSLDCIFNPVYDKIAVHC